MIDTKKELWCRFRKSLIKNIDFNELKNAWKDPARTAFYKNELFPKISKELDLYYSQKEYLRVDAIFYKKDKVTCDWEIPIVFIESENNIESIHDSGYGEELFKLCYVA